MTDDPRPGHRPRSQPTGAAADVLDRVAWDFDPEDDLVSPLVTTERYFRDFPWETEDQA